MASGNGGIFISYRRQETAWPARQLYEVLASRYGTQSVFKDVDDIEPGEDFVDKITAAVASCDVLLALIGPQWLVMANSEGGRRLDDPEDFVRLELSAALSRGVRVVPILVDGARMPRADELPAELAPLVRRQAVEINPVGFNTDRLLSMLDGLLARPDAAPGAAAAPHAAAEPGRAGGDQDRPAPGEGSTASESVPPAQDSGPTQESAPQAPEMAPQESGPPESGPPESWPQPASRADESVPTPEPSRSPAHSDGPSMEPDATGSRGPTHWPGSTPGQGSTPAADGNRATTSPAPRSEPGANRRLPLLIGAGAVVVALVAGVLAWHPWTGGGSASSAGTPRPISSAGATAGASASAPASATASASTSSAPIVLPNPPILAHRGGMEKFQLETLEAMENAAVQGFAVETDIRYTSDKVAVLVHDEAATKGLDCGGQDVRVSKTSWAKLRKVCRSKPTAADPISHPIPTLDVALEAIAAASPTAWVFLEIKTDESDAVLRKLLATPAKYGLSKRTVWTSFTHDRLKRVHAFDPDARLMLFVSGTAVAVDKSDHLWGVAVELRVAKQAYLWTLGLLGLQVMVWNPNEDAQWSAVARLKPDLVMTDYPGKYQQWLANR